MHESSAKRLLFLTSMHASFFVQLSGRLYKPFNPILGETYEYVTEEFRFLAEAVSHHPPIFVFHMEGTNFDLLRVSNPLPRFTGKRIEVTDKNLMKMVISVQMPDGS